MTAVIVIGADVTSSKKPLSSGKGNDAVLVVNGGLSKGGTSLMGWRQGIPVWLFSVCYEMGCLHTIVTAALTLLWRVTVTHSEPSEGEGCQPGPVEYCGCCYTYSETH